MLVVIENVCIFMFCSNNTDIASSFSGPTKLALETKYYNASIELSPLLLGTITELNDVEGFILLPDINEVCFHSIKHSHLNVEYKL